MLQKSKILAAVSFTEGIIAFIWLISIPAGDHTLSPTRIGSLLGILIVTIGWLFVYFQTTSALSAIQQLMNWTGKSIFACLSICAPLLALSIAAQQDIWSHFVGEALYARLIPILIWSSILLMQIGIFLLTAEVERTEILQSLPRLWKPTGLLLLCFILIWGFITITKIGVTSDVVGLSWGPPGTPITFGQVAFVFAISIYMTAFYLPGLTKFMRANWLIDAICFIGLWALAAFLWWRQPLIPSHFAPVPVAPNFEYYPASDAALFDTPAYQLLFGAGFNTQLVRRPVYVAMLALFHKLAGPSYERTIFLQILALALIPAVIYLLVTKLSNRMAGLLAGGLVAIREANAIRLTKEVIVSDSKMMMSDLVTMLGVVVIIYVAINLLNTPRRNPWQLAILGAVLGLTVLVRTQTVILLPVIMLFFFVNKQSFKSRLYEPRYILLGFIVILSPWVWRDWNLTGTFVLDDRGEERLLARDYSANPLVLPPLLPNESEIDFSTRLHKEVFTYAASHPGDVLFFVSNHFFHNLTEAVLYISPVYSNSSPENLIDLVPFWETWNGSLTKTNSIFLFINLAIIAFGIAVAQQKFKLAGWLPLIIFIVYSFGNALVRTSGWRFSLPVDWIILMYTCIALAYIPSQLGKLIQKEESTQLSQAEESQARQTFLLPAIFALLFLTGASLPIAERLIPARDFGNFTVEAGATLSQANLLTPAELSTFMQQENAVFISGIALYPRYYEPDGKLYLPDTPSDYSYLHFVIIGKTSGQIVLPLQDAPHGVPHTATVLVIGCKDVGYISAWAVIVDSQPKQILMRDPQMPLQCPLSAPK